MEPTTLAIGLAGFLAPYLPYLLKASEAAAKEAGKKFGDAAWNRATSVWAMLQPKVEANPGAKTAVERAAARPEDARVASALELEFEELMKTDPPLASRLAELLEGAKGASVTVQSIGDRSVAIGGNLTGGSIVTGDQKQ